MCPLMTLASHMPWPGTGSCRRRSSPALSLASFAVSRFLPVIRRTQNCPRLLIAQMCVNPRKLNVSGFPAPRAFRLGMANRPNPVSRVLPGCSSRLNFANLSRSAVRNRSASSWYWNPATKSSAKRTMITSPRASWFRHHTARRSRTWCRYTLASNGETGAPCGHPLADQPQDPFIRDPVPEKLLRPASVKRPGEVADIRVQHPAHLRSLNPGRQRVQRTMRAAARPEPVGEAREIRLEHGIEHLHHSALDDLVLQRRHPQRAHPPVRFRYQHPPHRPGPVLPRLHPPEQILQVSPQVLLVLPPRQPVRARRRVPFQFREHLPQPFQRDVVQQRGEPRILLPYSNFPHTIQPTWHAWPGSASGTCFAVRVPHAHSPFLHRLRRPRP